MQVDYSLVALARPRPLRRVQMLIVVERFHGRLINVILDEWLLRNVARVHRISVTHADACCLGARTGTERAHVTSDGGSALVANAILSWRRLERLKFAIIAVVIVSSIGVLHDLIKHGLVHLLRSSFITCVIHWRAGQGSEVTSRLHAGEIAMLIR